MSDYRIDAFIAGAEKAGTTSLGYYISQHPLIHSHFQWSEEFSGKVLEFGAFLDERWRDREFFEHEYLAAFRALPEEGHVVVAKSVGIMHRDGAARNLKEFSPGCKLIVSLRNPVNRAYSSFWYQRYRGEETLATFEEAVDLEMQHCADGGLSRHRQYLGKGRYFEQLLVLFDLFGAENVRVVLTEDLKTAPDATLNEIFSFLGLPSWEIDTELMRNTSRIVRSPAIAQFVGRDSYWKSLGRRFLSRSNRKRLIEWARRQNSAIKRPEEMGWETREMLLDYFRPHNARLEDVLGRDLGDWDK